MSHVVQLLRTPVPLWPFRWLSAVGFPLLLMAVGSHRVWVTASTPFEQYLGITATVGVALLWSLVFGRTPERA